MRSIPRLVALVSVVAASLSVLGWSAEALADSTTLSPPTAMIYPIVDSNLGVSGARSINVGVTHTDGGWFCSKIAEADIVDSTTHIVIGSKKLSSALCNFNTNDVTITVTPWSDAAIVGACAGKVGQALTLTSYMDTCLSPTAGSFNPGVLFSGQQNQCGKASLSVTAMISCPPAPSPPATNPAPTGTTTTGTTTTTSNGTGVVVGAFLPPTTYTLPGTTTPLPVVVLAPGRASSFRPGAQVVSIDPSLLGKLVVGWQAQNKGAVDADYASLGAAYTLYASASQAYQAKYATCMNQLYTPAQQLAACAATDTTVVCAQKLVAACDATELNAMNKARAAVNAAAAKLATDAQALATLTSSN